MSCVGAIFTSYLRVYLRFARNTNFYWLHRRVLSSAASCPLKTSKNANEMCGPEPGHGCCQGVVGGRVEKSSSPTAQRHSNGATSSTQWRRDGVVGGSQTRCLFSGGRSSSSTASIAIRTLVRFSPRCWVLHVICIVKNGNKFEKLFDFPDCFFNILQNLWMYGLVAVLGRFE